MEKGKKSVSSRSAPGRGAIADTHRQQLLAHLLREKEVTDEGWRAYLLTRKRQGYSNSRIGRELYATLGFGIDASTLADWVKQARREEAAKVSNASNEA